MLEDDFATALRDMFAVLSDEITVTRADDGVTLCANIAAETIGRVIVHQNDYPVDVEAKMSGFRISMTLRSQADWHRNMPYLINGYQKLRVDAKKAARE